MSIDIAIRTVVEGGTSQIDNLDKSLSSVESSANSASTAIGQLGQAGQQAGTQAAAGAGAGADAFDELAASTTDAGDGMAQLRQLVASMTAPLADVETAAESAGDGLDKALAAFYSQRQDNVFERIRGPMREYSTDVDALDVLLSQGRITQAEYAAEFDRLTTKVGAMQGPVQQLTEEMRLQQQILERITAPARDLGNTLDALSALYRDGKIAVGDYDAEVSKALAKSGQMQGPVQQVSDELKREQHILESIRGPMRDYEANLEALNALYSKGQVNADEYSKKLEQLKKSPGAPQQKDDGMGKLLEDGIGAVSSKFGAAGQIVGSLASEGTIAAAAIIGLATEMVHLGDQYIAVSNEAQRFAGAGADLSTVLQQQLDLSRELHTGLAQTEHLYASVREGTEDLNLSTSQQIQLTKEIGDAVIASGKSAESAEGMMRRLSFAFASGTVPGRELRSIMREFPAIGDGFVAAMGHSRKELIDLGNKGQISSEMLISAFNKMGPELEEKVGKRAETTGQMWQHFKDQLVLSVGKLVESTGIFKAFGVVLDGAAAIITFVTDAVTLLASGFSSITDALGPLKYAFLPVLAAFDLLKGAVSVVKDIGAALSRAALSDSAAKQLEIARAYLTRMEVLKQLGVEEEKNAKTAKTATAAASLGIDVGPFDEDQANRVAELRITMRQAGLEMSDAFDKAHNKAAMFNAQLDKMSESESAKKVTEDVKRLWDAMHGADTILDGQFKKWHDISDKVRDITNAIAKWKDITPPGAPTSQEQRDLQRQKRDLLNQQELSQYGNFAVQHQSQQDHAGDNLRDLQRELKAGEIGGEAFRIKYDELMTTLNDGRLPDAIKLWEGFNGPIKEFTLQLGGLNALYANGAMDRLFGGPKDNSIAAFHRYNAELTKLASTLVDLGDRDLEAAERHALNAGMAGPRTIGGIGVALGVDRGENDADMADAAKARLDAASAPGTLGPAAAAARSASSAGTPQYEGLATVLDQLNEKRQKLLSDEQYAKFNQPLQAYKDALEGIARAENDADITGQQALALRKQANEAYRSAQEALDPVLKLVHESTAGQRQYNEQLQVLEQAKPYLTVAKYNEQVDKLRAAFLSSSEEGKTFFGGMEAGWLKLKAGAESFGASVAGLVLSDVDKLNDAIVTAANGGAVAWGQMVESMLADLEKLLLKQLEVKALNAVIGSFSGSGDSSGSSSDGTSGDGVGNLLSGLAGKIGGSLLGDAAGAAPSITPSVVVAAPASASSASDSPAAYPAAAVAAAAPQQQRAANSRTTGDASDANSTSPIQVHVHNHYDEDVMHAAMQSREGQQILVNFLRANKNLVR